MAAKSSASSKETKACGNPYCDQSLPASSKHTSCARCRGHDKSLSKRTPTWMRARRETVRRWEYNIVSTAPRGTFKETSSGVFADSKVVQLRKRA